MSLKLSGISIAIWCLLSLTTFVKEKTIIKVTKNDLISIVILSLLYIFYIGNYLFTLDVILIKKLETCLSFLVLPLFIILNKSNISKNTLNYSLVGFFMANTILALISWFKIFQTGFFKMLNDNNYYQPVFRNIFSDTTNIHLPYLGLFYVFSIFIGIYSIQREYRKYTIAIRSIIFLICILLFISMLFFTARMALLSFIIVFIYWAFKSFQNKRLFASLFISLVLLTSIIVLLTPMKERIFEAIHTKFELPSEKLNDQSEHVNFRYGILYCSINVIKNNWLIGVGKNNVQRKLDECYDGFTYNNYDDFKQTQYNSHNQYIDLWIAYGILGMVPLTISFFFGFSINNNLLYNIFLLLIFLALLTENIFDRQLGVIFFTFFNSLFFITKTK
ncbi:O-antigen ligase family protein [Aureibaculum luteum]|uniref:O-antigen ligase family protein n=1 Tax=Aureibaculum luteum TaxID=1548456 RepID=UPI001300666F|nr:O-antigen ligase family protein [Aureibaculum luteum]